ncbi:PAS domain-containing sensor histidine kinase [Maribellus maritimus]|uniref:PAS domain-containing sensor histidine kinase n=1 Tax=Maribellus maritimus TaxID=2870838 RepID=UPI001EEB71F5|nr:PAS domain-containing sensor histidine kinase [Maribellus maritimus]MCG6188879.1 PAS domain-containing sensor histidine kinase [Maribellus maritimus]
MDTECSHYTNLIIKLANSSTEAEVFSHTISYFDNINYILGTGIYLSDSLKSSLFLAKSNLSDKILPLFKTLKKNDDEYKLATEGGTDEFYYEGEKKQETKTLYKHFYPIKFNNKLFGSLLVITKREYFNSKQKKSLFNCISAQIGSTLYLCHLQKKLEVQHKDNTHSKVAVSNHPFKTIQTTNNNKRAITVTNEKNDTCLLSQFPIVSKYKIKRKLDINNYNTNSKTLKSITNNQACFLFQLLSDKDGIWDWDLITNTTHFSSHLEKLLGYERGEIISNFYSWSAFVHPEDLSKLNKSLSLHIKGKKDIHKIEYRVLCKNGLYKWIHEQGKIVEKDKQGKPLRMLAFFTDISNYKFHESTLLSNLKREKELNQTKSQLMSLTSHEFKSPLAIIHSTAESLEVYFDKMSPNERSLKVKKIKKSVKSLLDALNWAGKSPINERGKLNYNPNIVDLANYLKEIVDVFKERNKSGHRIEFFTFESKILVNIDKILIKHVILNILSNAIKYSPEELPVKIKTRKQKNKVSIQILDQGIGIPSKDKDLIFQPYLRGSNVENTSGTGLGLSLCQRILEIHGGRITFTSDLNKGTTFTISLPFISNG